MPALWFASALLDHGWRDHVRIVVESGLIASIDIAAEPCPDDERHAVAVPGLPNLHSHAFQRGMAGLAEVGGGTANFWSWRELMYRFVARLDPEGLRALAAQAYVEMLESGFTRVGEFHYLHHAEDGRAYDDPAEMGAAIAGAAEETGIGLALLPVYYAHGGFGALPPSAGQARFITDAERYALLIEASRKAVSSLDDAVVGLAPHSLRAVAPGELRRVLEIDASGPIHIHVAEQQQEVADCLAWSGARPVEWLADNADLDTRWCLVHATHVTDEELSRIAAASAVVGLCPITEANLGDGIFPARDFAGLGGRYGLGSDSNVLISAAEEMRLLEYAQRLSLQSRGAMATPRCPSTGASIFCASLAGGAQALGCETGLAVGRAADIVSLDPTHVSLAGRSGDALLDAWIFATAADPVDTVWRFGRKVVSGGRHHRRDEVARRYLGALHRLV